MPSHLSLKAPGPSAPDLHADGRPVSPVLDRL